MSASPVVVQGLNVVCVINKGRIVTQGSPDEVKARLTAQFLLIDPATNLLIIGGAFAAFMVVGTAVFVRSERDR